MRNIFLNLDPITTICLTLLIIFFALTIMPKRRRESVTIEFSKILRLFPISQIIQAWRSKTNKEPD